MARRIPSSDVLDANAKTTRDIEAEVIGRFRPTGPNRWDDWELERENEGERITIPAGNILAVEPLGAKPELRLRFREGRSSVLRLRWIPSEEDERALASGQWGEQESEQATFFERVFGMVPEDDPRDDMLAYFFDRLADPYASERGDGALAALVKKLRAARE